MIEKRYLDISRDIEALIESDASMERLPGVFCLAKKFNSAPQTVTKAIRILSEKGRVTVNGTRGTFVTRNRPPRQVYKRLGILAAMERGLSMEEKAELKRLSESLGYEIFSVEYDAASPDAAVLLISSLPADGFVLTFRVLSPELVAGLRLAGKQFVSVNRVFDIPGVSWVDFDNDRAIGEGLRILAAAGRKRIALAGFRWELKGHQDAIKAVHTNFLASLGVHDDGLWLAEEDYMEYWRRLGEEAHCILGTELGGRLADMENPPNAVLTVSARVALGIQKALADRGLRVPRDVSMLAYCMGEEKGLPGAETLSTIGLPNIARISRALEVLAELVENPGSGPRQELLSFEHKKGETI